MIVVEVFVQSLTSGLQSIVCARGVPTAQDVAAMGRAVGRAMGRAMGQAANSASTYRWYHRDHRGTAATTANHGDHRR